VLRAAPAGSGDLTQLGRGPPHRDCRGVASDTPTCRSTGWLCCRCGSRTGRAQGQANHPAVRCCRQAFATAPAFKVRSRLYCGSRAVSTMTGMEESWALCCKRSSPTKPSPAVRPMSRMMRFRPLFPSHGNGREAGGGVGGLENGWRASAGWPLLWANLVITQKPEGRDEGWHVGGLLLAQKCHSHQTARDLPS
jgi:hypothetical protein